MAKDCKTLISYGAGIASLATAMSVLIVTIAHLVAPSAIEAWFESGNAKLIEMIFVGSFFTAIGLQLFLFFYLPTPRRLALNLIWWGGAFCMILGGSISLSTLRVAITPDPKPGESWFLFEVGDTSLSSTACFVVAMSLTFMYLMFCKYQSLHEEFLADVD